MPTRWVGLRPDFSATRLQSSTNLTIILDAEVLNKARLRALKEGTSINKLLRLYLEGYVGEDERRQGAVERILQLSRRSKSSSGGRKVKRDDLYDRRQ